MVVTDLTSYTEYIPLIFGRIKTSGLNLYEWVGQSPSCPIDDRSREYSLVNKDSNTFRFSSGPDSLSPPSFLHRLRLSSYGSRTRD